MNMMIVFLLNVMILDFKTIQSLTKVRYLKSSSWQWCQNRISVHLL